MGESTSRKDSSNVAQAAPLGSPSTRITFSVWFKDFLAGTMGGVAGIVVGAPLDTVRVRMATQTDKGALAVFRTTLKDEGVRGLFRGMVPPMIGAGLVNAVLFSVWGKLNEFQYNRRPVEDKKDPAPTLKEVFFSGFGAGFLQCFIICPADLIKILLQGQKDFSKYKGPWDCTVKVVKEGGPRALFRGMIPTIWRDAPSFGVYFYVYEYLKRFVFRRPNEEFTSNFGIMASGSAAGVADWLVCYPMDLVNSRMQMDQVGKYAGMNDCFRKSYREGGIPIFFRGLVPTLSRAIIVNGPIFYVYEYSLAFLESFEEDL
jgi:solute carrier family 25 carnitine/acylcarnitine transporter 20/29